MAAVLRLQELLRPSGASPDEALRLGATCAAANCLADSPGGARLEDIRGFQKEIPVQTLEAGL